MGCPRPSEKCNEYYCGGNSWGICVSRSTKRMTIIDVANELSKCANKVCGGCRFSGHENCREEKVREMGEVVRQIAEQMKGEQNESR